MDDVTKSKRAIGYYRKHVSELNSIINLARELPFTFG
jgi:hypothetical protein